MKLILELVSLQGRCGNLSIKNSFESLFYTMSFFVGALMRWGHIFLFYVSAKIMIFVLYLQIHFIIK